MNTHPRFTSLAEVVRYLLTHHRISPRTAANWQGAIAGGMGGTVSSLCRQRFGLRTIETDTSGCYTLPKCAS